MISGNQADLRRYLLNELGIKVSRQAISLRVKAKDYRFKFTPGGKLIIDETAKLLADSGFGKRARFIRAKNGESKGRKPKIEADQTKSQDDKKTDLKDRNGKDLITEKRAEIELEKVKQQTEKVRIENETKLKNLIKVDDIGEAVFNVFRQIRDHMQSQKDRCGSKLLGLDSIHEIEKVLKNDNHKGLESIVSNYQNLDDEGLKKKLLALFIE